MRVFLVVLGWFTITAVITVISIAIVVISLSLYNAWSICVY
jgi:hypothetical protein